MEAAMFRKQTAFDSLEKPANSIEAARAR